MKERMQELKDLMNEGSETSKLRMLNQLSDYYMLRDLKKAYLYCKKAIQSIIYSNNHVEIATACYNMANYYRLNNQLKEASDLLHKAITYNQNASNILTIKIYKLISNIYAYLHQFEKSSHYAYKCLDICNQTGEEQHLHHCYLAIGLYHFSLEEFDVANYYFSEAKRIVSIYESEQSSAYINLAIAQTKLSMGDTNVEELLKHVEDYIDSTSDLWLLGSLNIFWACYHIQHDAFELAQSYYEIGLDILEEENTNVALIQTHLSLVHSLTIKEKHYEAESVLKKVESYYEANRLVLGLPKLYLAFSKHYSHQGNINLYNQYLRKYIHVTEELYAQMPAEF